MRSPSDQDQRQYIGAAQAFERQSSLHGRPKYSGASEIIGKHIIVRIELRNRTYCRGASLTARVGALALCEGREKPLGPTSITREDRDISLVVDRTDRTDPLSGECFSSNSSRNRTTAPRCSSCLARRDPLITYSLPSGSKNCPAGPVPNRALIPSILYLMPYCSYCFVEYLSEEDSGYAERGV